MPKIIDRQAFINEVLSHRGKSNAAIARLMGLKPATLIRRMQRYGFEWRDMAGVWEPAGSFEPAGKVPA